MPEWKNYEETQFTDFGSVGETQMADDSDFGGFNSFGDKTQPVDEFGFSSDTPYDHTVVDEPGTGTATVGGWGNAEETIVDDKGVINSVGQNVRPAAGWLVCIEGVAKGVDYRIYSGYSYIGRDPAQNAVAIPDPRISSVPSARILYDVESRKFYINESNGARNPVYLNGELFDGRVELHAYDVIKLGGTKLLFVPLCTEKFAWGDEEK